MPVRVFEIFAKTINGLPPESVFRALDLECKMLEEDQVHDRLHEMDDALSILSFRQFLRMARDGDSMHCVKPLPPDHLEFYKETIVRLVHAGQLPDAAMDQFNFTFVSVFNP